MTKIYSPNVQKPITRIRYRNRGNGDWPGIKFESNDEIPNENQN